MKYCRKYKTPGHCGRQCVFFLQFLHFLYAASPSLYKFFTACSLFFKCKKSMGKRMDYLMEILYVGGLAVFFLLVWALIQVCDKLGAKA